MVGWIVYGFVLYYSDANDCEKFADTAIFISIMFVVLLIGYLVIFAYVVLLCMTPCLYMAVRDQAE